MYETHLCEELSVPNGCCAITIRKSEGLPQRQVGISDMEVGGSRVDSTLNQALQFVIVLDGTSTVEDTGEDKFVKDTRPRRCGEAEGEG